MSTAPASTAELTVNEQTLLDLIPVDGSRLATPMLLEKLKSTDET